MYTADLWHVFQASPQHTYSYNWSWNSSMRYCIFIRDFRIPQVDFLHPTPSWWSQIDWCLMDFILSATTMLTHVLHYTAHKKSYERLHQHGIHSKHQIGRLISWEPNIVGCWKFEWCYSTWSFDRITHGTKKRIKLPIQSLYNTTA